MPFIIRLRNLFSFRYRIVPVRITIQDKLHKETAIAYYKIRKHPHRRL